MTPEELQELRDWSARKMGWVKEEIGYVVPLVYYTKGLERPSPYTSLVSDWLPDRPESGQIWLLVERMRELGWYLSLDQCMVEPYEWTAQFFTEIHTHPVGLGTIDMDNPCLSILKAAKATEE